MEWHILLAAVVTGAGMHQIMEPANVMIKLNRLGKAIKTGKIDELAMKGIDTRTKSYGLGIVLISVMIAVAYIVVNLVDPSVTGAIQYSIVVVIAAELVAMMKIDKYHITVEKLTQSLKKK